MGAGAARRHVVAAKAQQAVARGLRELEPGLFEIRSEAYEVVAPGSPTKAVQQGLHRQLHRLLGQEAGPVVVLASASRVAAPRARPASSRQRLNSGRRAGGPPATGSAGRRHAVRIEHRLDVAPPGES